MATMLGRKRASAKDEELTGGKIREFYRAGYQAIQEETYNYWLNYAFLRNQQWLWFNIHRNELAQLPEDPDRVQATINKVLASTRSILSKATSRALRFDVPPTKADDATVRAAHISEAILKNVHREHDWESKRELHAWAMWRGGTAAVAVDWDAQALPIPNERTESGRVVGQGDTVETVLSIADFVVQPGAKDGERARWWIKAQALPPEDVQADYNLADKPKADAKAGTTPLQSRLAATTNRDMDPPLTLVLTYYERPNTQRPDGIIATVVDDAIVETSPWYFPFKDKLNLAIGRETFIDDRWTGDTVLTAARAIQTAINVSWSSIIEHMKLAGNARLAIPQSTIALIDMLTDEPGEFIPYPDGTEKPSWLAPPQMPSWWIDQPVRLREELDDILSNHAVSRGDAPDNVQSGYGLSILSENDSTPLGRFVKETAHVWGKVGTMVLRIYAAKVTEKRTAKVVTAGRAPETTHWSGNDLMGQTTAEIPVDAVMPRSRAAMEMFAQKMLEMGLIHSAAEFAHIADLPEQDEMIAVIEPDIDKARAENYEMAQGEVCIPEQFDDHAKHIHEHNNFRKSATYRQIKKSTNNVVQIIDDHVKAHATLAAEEMGQQQARGAISPALAAAPTAGGAPVITPGQASGMMPSAAGIPPEPQISPENAPPPLVPSAL